MSVNKKVVLAWVPSHVGIKGNEKVDELAKQALNFNVFDKQNDVTFAVSFVRKGLVLPSTPAHAHSTYLTACWGESFILNLATHEKTSERNYSTEI